MRGYFYILLSFLLLLSLPVITFAQSNNPALQSRLGGKLRVAIDATYPPMEFEKDGKPQGFDVEFAEVLAHQLGQEVEFVVSDWSGIIAGLSSNRYDLIISSMNITEERRREVDFVEYIQMYQVFVSRPGINIKKEADLKDRVVAVQTDTTSSTWAEASKKRGSGIREIKAFPGATDAFAALNAAQVDVIVIDEPVGKYYARLSPGLFISGTAMEAEPVGIALRKGDEVLKEAVAQAVDELKKESALQPIADRWFGGLEQFAQTRKSFWEFSRDVVLPRLLQGMRLTIFLTLISGGIGVFLGLGFALARLSKKHFLKLPATIYVTLFRGTPLLLQIFFVFYALPPMLGIRLSALASGILALSLNLAAYVAETFRAAIQSIDRGQTEAALALGMNENQTMRRVILPQTFRRLIPPLVNEVAALSKDTSLVSVLAIHETLYETNRVASAYLRPWEVYAWAALGYLCIVLLLSAVAHQCEKRLEARGI